MIAILLIGGHFFFYLIIAFIKFVADSHIVRTWLRHQRQRIKAVFRSERTDDRQDLHVPVDCDECTRHEHPDGPLDGLGFATYTPTSAGTFTVTS